MLVLTYGIQKFNKLIYRQQPTITVETAQNFFTNKDEVSLNDDGFKIAFGVMDYTENKRLSDPDFVRFQVFLEVRKDLKVVDNIPLAYHTCTQADYDSFYTISVNNIDFAKQLLEHEILYCLDEGQDLTIRGADEIDSVALNIDFTPCDRVEGSVCASRTLEELQTYLGHPEMVIMSNQQRFDNTIYTHETIISEAVIWNQHIDKRQANWMKTTYDSMGIADEIAYLDIGIVTPRSFSRFSLDRLGLSYSDDFEGYYKIAGFTVFRNMNYTVITRSVYDALNFLGDVGGLEGILTQIGGWLVSWAASFVGTGYFMTSLFYTRQSRNGEEMDGGSQNEYQRE